MRRPLASLLITALCACSSAPRPAQGNLASDKNRDVPQRLAPAPSPRLVADLWPGSPPLVAETALFQAGSLAYFVGGAGEKRCALWVTDGTDEGTKKVWDYPNPQRCADLSWIAPLGDAILALTTDDALMRVQGTSIQLLRQPSPAPREPLEPDVLYTTPLHRPREFSPRCDAVFCSESFSPRGVVRGGAHVYWLDYDPQTRIPSLWASDGTAAGTRLVAPLSAESAARLVQLGEDALLWRCEDGASCALWQLAPEASKLKRLASSPHNGLTEASADFVHKGQPCLILKQPVADTERSQIIKSDTFCLRGGKLVRDKGANDTYSSLSQYKDQPVFEASAGWYARERVTLGQRVIARAWPDKGRDRLRFRVWVGADAFEVDPLREQPALWVLPAGVEDEQDDAYGWRPLGPRAGAYGGSPQLLTPLDDGRVVFFAWDEAHGMEPRVMGADGQGVTLLADLQQGEVWSAPALVTAHGTHVCFTLTTATRWCTDGTPKGMQRMPTVLSWPLRGGVATIDPEDGWSVKDPHGRRLIAPLHGGEGDDDMEGEQVDALQEAQDGAELERIRAASRVLVWRGLMYVTREQENGDHVVLVTDGTSAGTVALTGPLSRFGGPAGDFTPLYYPLARHSYLGHFGHGSAGDMLWGPELWPDATGRVGWSSADEDDGRRAWWSDGTVAGTKATPAVMRSVRLDPRTTVELDEGSTAWLVRGGRSGELRYDARYRIEQFGAQRGRLWWVQSRFISGEGEEENGQQISALMSWWPGEAEATQLIEVRDGEIEVLGERSGLMWLRANRRGESKLWATDGTEAGTRWLETEGPVPLEPRPVVTPAGLVFSMDHPKYGLELFVWPVEAR